MGVYDIDQDGITLTSGKSGVDVGLWDDTGNLLGQVLVSGGTAAPILEGFRYATLGTSIDLTTGSFYRVAADMSDISGTDHVDNAVPTITNGIDSIQGADFNSFDFPTNLRTSGQAQLGGNILFEDSVLVPFEVDATLGLLLVGGLFAGNKMYRRNRK